MMNLFLIKPIEHSEKKDFTYFENEAGPEVLHSIVK